MAPPELPVGPAVEGTVGGTVAWFDEAGGYGAVEGDGGEQWFFHCTAIADGSRTIEVGPRCASRSSPGTWDASRHVRAWRPDLDRRVHRGGVVAGSAVPARSALGCGSAPPVPERICTNTAWSCTSPWRRAGPSSPRRSSDRVEHRRHGVDGQRGLVEVRGLLAEVDGGQLEEAAEVVGDDL